MDLLHQFPNVHRLHKGGISSVYEVHPQIVVKVPKAGEDEREQFRKEPNIYRILSRNPSCNSSVRCFFCSDRTGHLS